MPNHRQCEVHGNEENAGDNNPSEGEFAKWMIDELVELRKVLNGRWRAVCG